jgi:hypothetical protein
MNEYSTLSRLRTHLALGSAATTDDDQLRRFLLNASRAIDRYTKRNFYPMRKQGTNTLKQDLPSDLTLRFEFDILEVKG